LQVSFLGLFSILMGSRAELKREAVAALEAGGLFALGISEKDHGADLFGNEFVVTETSPGEFVANGGKYYIGNSNCASMISILARKEKASGRATHSRRAPFVLFALRPNGSGAFNNGRKIRTLGVRAGYVGAFDVNDHPFPETDLIASGRDAWDATFGAVTLGKFFLGFASIGIGEHGWHEAIGHLSGRVLYDKPVIEMPHIRLAMAQAFTRMTAMKLYAYRALDYIHAAHPEDRRYILFAAVQKARVSTQGVKVMALMSECIGAKGFEADTYFEMALRDVQLIPSLEGSTHVNLGLAAQFAARYFANPAADVVAPPSLITGEVESRENAYLMEARNGAIPSIFFAHFLAAYKPLLSIRNVRLFVSQIKAFRLFVRSSRFRCAAADGTQLAQAMGQCLAVIVYAQLVAENATRVELPAPMVCAIFHTLIEDLSAAALAVASLPGLHALDKLLIRRVVAVPQTEAADWAFVAGRMV
jgi:acyl-CoA dehydrogenase